MTSLCSRFKWRTLVFIATLLAMLSTVFALAFPLSVAAAAGLVRLSRDPYTNSSSQHQTEIEPDTYAFGSTVVSTFQVGASSMVEAPTTAGQHLTTPAQHGNMAICLVRLCMQHRLDPTIG